MHPDSQTRLAALPRPGHFPHIFGVATAFATQSVKSAIESAKKSADRFEEHFARALDQSPVDGSDLEDRLNSWADFTGDQLDEVASSYFDGNFQKQVDHFENAMIAATGINRFMLGYDFLDPAHLLDRADINQALGQIEDSLDRFSEKFENAIRYYSTSSGTRRADFFTRWADDLERASDQMLEERKEKDPKEFQQQLDNTLVVASAINRIMARCDLDKAAHLEWNNVRKELNTVASAFGRPVLPELNVQIRRSASR